MKGSATKENGLSSLMHGVLRNLPSDQGDVQVLAGDSGEDRSMSAAVMLSDVAELVMGQSPPSTSYNDACHGLPFYQGKTDFGATYPTPRIYCREPKKIAEAGDILMSVRAPVGATNLCHGKSCIGRGIAAIRPTGIDRDFLYFYLKKIEAYIDSIGSGAIFRAINKSQLAELPINEAGIPFPEQKKIAYVLSTVQRAIEAQERIIQSTIELKKALMRKLFTEGLRNEPQKQTEIGPIPESWEVKRFDSFSVLQRGYDITKKQQQSGDFPVVSSGGVSSYHDEAKVKGPGVVIGRKGSLGTVHYIPDDYWPHDTTLWVKNFKGNNPKFVASLLETLKLKRFDTGAANPTLNRNIVHGEKIAIPPVDQQEEIGQALEAVESKIATHERKRTSFQDLFRTLLHELMTAKIRVASSAITDR